MEIYGNNLASSPGVQAETTRIPQVQEAFNRLENLIDANQKLCGEMEQRLSPILRMEPQAAGQTSKDDPTVVGLAQRLSESAARLERLADNYSSMIRRIEL